MDEEHKVREHDVASGGRINFVFVVGCPTKEGSVLLSYKPSYCPLCGKELLTDEKRKGYFRGGSRPEDG